VQLGTIHPQKAKPQVAERRAEHVDRPVDIAHAGLARQTTIEDGLGHEECVEIDAPSRQGVGARETRHEHHQPRVLAPIGMHPYSTCKRHPSGYPVGGASADLTAFAATAEAFDVPVEQAQRGCLGVEGARRPIIDAHGEGSYGPAIRLGGQQNKGIAWRMRPIVGTVDGKQRHPAGAVGGIDGGEPIEVAEGKAQAEPPYSMLEAQEQRDQ